MSKPCAFTGQSLLDHSINSYNVLIKYGFLDDIYYIVVSRRLNVLLSKYGTEISSNEVKQLIELVVKLHDIGKAAEYYQSQFTNDCRSPVPNPSFVFHEVGSALFFYHSNYTEDTRIKRLLALAALNHLNAMRGLKQLKPNELPKGYKQDMLKLKKYGSILMESLGYSFDIRDYDTNDYVLMMNDLINHNEPYLKLYNLFLAPVIIGDSIDSHYARGLSERRRFIELLERELMGEVR